MSRSRMLELLEPRQLLSADVLESSAIAPPVLSMPALSVDAGKLERFAADDMLLIRTDGGEDGCWSLSPCGENEQRDKDRRILVKREQGEIEVNILNLVTGKLKWINEKWEKAPTTQPTTQPSTERWRDLAE